MISLTEDLLHRDSSSLQVPCLRVPGEENQVFEFASRHGKDLLHKVQEQQFADFVRRQKRPDMP